MAKQQLDAKAENQKLQEFLSSISFFLEEFVDDGQKEGYNFDYSLSSADELELYISNNKELMDWKNDSELSKWKRMYAWCYIGETFRKAFGGKWIVSLDDMQNLNYGKWVIKGFDVVGVEFDPLRTLQAYLLRGKPHIKSMMEAHVNTVPLDLSEFPEEDVK